VRGLAHVGVIKTLLKHKIPIDYIAGSSIGAWVGIHYALFKDYEKLHDFTVGKKKEKFRSFLEPTLTGGLIKGIKMEALFDEWLEHKTFDDLKIPLKAVATDLLTGNEVILDKGPLSFAARTSMSIPTIFSPVHHNGIVLVDGGISNPVPDDVAKRMGADIVVSVNLDDFRGDGRYTEEDMSLTGVASRSIEVMRHYLALHSLKDSDIIIAPPVAKYSNWKEYFWNDMGEEIAKIGEDATEKIIPALKLLLDIK